MLAGAERQSWSCFHIWLSFVWSSRWGRRVPDASWDQMHMGMKYLLARRRADIRSEIKPLNVGRLRADRELTRQGEQVQRLSFVGRGFEDVGHVSFWNYQRVKRPHRKFVPYRKCKVIFGHEGPRIRTAKRTGVVRIIQADFIHDTPPAPARKTRGPSSRALARLKRSTPPAHAFSPPSNLRRSAAKGPSFAPSGAGSWNVAPGLRG